MTATAPSTTRAFLRRIMMLMVGTFGTAGLAFLTQLLLTRAMSLSDYGLLAALLAAVNVATPIASMGMGWFWLDLFGREGRQAIGWIKQATWLACAFTAVCARAANDVLGENKRSDLLGYACLRKLNTQQKKLPREPWSQRALQRTSGMGASLMLTLEAVLTALLARQLYGETMDRRV